MIDPKLPGADFLGYKNNQKATEKKVLRDVLVKVRLLTSSLTHLPDDKNDRATHSSERATSSEKISTDSPTSPIDWATRSAGKEKMSPPPKSPSL